VCYFLKSGCIDILWSCYAYTIVNCRGHRLVNCDGDPMCYGRAMVYV